MNIFCHLFICMYLSNNSGTKKGRVASTYDACICDECIHDACMPEYANIFAKKLHVFHPYFYKIEPG